VKRLLVAVLVSVSMQSWAIQFSQDELDAGSVRLFQMGTKETPITSIPRYDMEKAALDISTKVSSMQPPKPEQVVKAVKARLDTVEKQRVHVQTTKPPNTHKILAAEKPFTKSTQKVTIVSAEPPLILDRRVGNAYFTGNITQQPKGRVSKRQGTIYFLTEVWGMHGKTLIHRWRSNGRVVEETRFAVGGPKWRSWSRFEISKDFQGPIEVSVYDGKGELLAQQTL